MRDLVQILNGRHVKARLQWNPRDMWIGVYWSSHPLCWQLYVCLVPMFPLRVAVLKRYFRDLADGPFNWLDRRIQ